MTEVEAEGEKGVESLWGLLEVGPTMEIDEQ